MPQQEVFFEQRAGDRRVEVLKTYDAAYARETLNGMDDEARSQLWADLAVEDKYEPGDLPPLHDPDTTDFLWEEIFDAARETYNQFSFFIVSESKDSNSTGLYVSPDWPSAEAFAKKRLLSVQ